MDLCLFFKSVIDSDKAPIVICDLNHTVVYMNQSAISRYHMDITGKSIKKCHNNESNEKIDSVINWFAKSTDNNIVFTSRNDNENNLVLYSIFALLLIVSGVCVANIKDKLKG